MADFASRKISPTSIVVDAVLTVAAFCLFFWLATTHVPSDDPIQVRIWSAYCAACMSGVFWLAWQMLKAVFHHQRAAAKTKV